MGIIRGWGQGEWVDREKGDFDKGVQTSEGLSSGDLLYSMATVVNSVLYISKYIYLLGRILSILTIKEL